MRSNLIGVALAAVVVAGLGGVGDADAKVKVGKPVQYAGAATVTQALTLVQASAKGDFTGVRRIVIPYFQVEVQSKGGKSESSKAFMSKMQNNVSISYKMVGLEQPAIQALTDRLYAAAVESFKARGIEVIDRADARARSKNYAKLEAAFQPGPKEFSPAGGGKSMIYAPTGMGIYYAGIEGADPTGGMGVFGGFAAMAKGFSNMGATMAEALAPGELDAALVGIRLKIVFVKTDSFKMNGFVEVNGKAVVSVSPVDTQLWIMAPKSQARAGGRVQFQLAAAVLPPANPIISVEDTTSTGRKIDTMLGNLIGGASGTSSYEVENYTVTIDPAKFEAAMGDTLLGTQQMLTDRLVAGRPDR